MIRLFPVLWLSLAASMFATATPIARDEAFPPPNSAKYLSGELTYVDHINRILYLRPDRTNLQPKAFQDLPLKITMLPYGAVRYHGAPARLRDIPIGTHLHGLFYLGPEGSYEMPKPKYPARPTKAFESQYSRCLLLEDDFSYDLKTGGKWQIESIDRDNFKIVARQLEGEKSISFDYSRATQVWQNGQLSELDSIQVGQSTLFNLTFATVYGPGRITEIWLDEKSIESASQIQTKVNLAWHRVRGLPGKIDRVTHFSEGKGEVRVTIFQGADPEMISEFDLKGGLRLHMAEHSQRIYGIDGAPGRISKIETIDDPPPGHSGVTITSTINELLEGIRPNRTVWIVPSGYEIPTKPREELLHTFDIWPKPNEEVDIETIPIENPDPKLPTATIHQFPTDKPVYLSGELIGIDHVNRRGVIRPDRSDVHSKYHWDLPHHFYLLPYGSVYYRGAKASLADIPIGTHLNGWFYLGRKGQFTVPLLPTNYMQIVKNQPNEYSPDSMLCAAVRLEDDFTFDQKKGRRWQIDSIDRENQKLALRPVKTSTQQGTVTDPTGYGRDKSSAEIQSFDFSEGTRIWQGKGYGGFNSLGLGQEVLINYTWATLYGPGILTDIWTDQESIATATQIQKNRHYQHLIQRGVPALVTRTENLSKGRGYVYATLYDSVDSGVLDSFKPKSSGMVVAVNQALRSYDQNNDFKIGTFREITRQDQPPIGSSGITIQLEFGEMLEGFSPGRTIRIFMRESKRQGIPREEQLWPEDVRPSVFTGPGD